jgi:malate dehydrogenase (quinone)
LPEPRRVGQPLRKCFAGELTEQAWLPKLKEMIPSYGISLIEDAAFTRKIRSETARALKIEDVNSKPMQAQDRMAAAP